MIFVTVGAQMPFDRLIQVVDAWAVRTGRDDVMAQIGPSDYVAQSLRTVDFVSPVELRRLISEASAVVAHAGMGTIITALEVGTPLLVFPRQGALGETRNDHQVATARHFGSAGHVLTAFDESELTRQLDLIERFRGPIQGSDRASLELLARIRDFVRTPRKVRARDS